MSAIQFRMARAALGFTVRELADKAGVHKNTIMRIEAGLASHGPTIAAVQRTLEEAGLVFISAEEGLGGPGVRLKWGVPEPLLAGADGTHTGTSSEGGVEAGSWDDDFEEFASDQPVTPYIIPISDTDRAILRQRFAEHPDTWNKLSDRAKAVYRRELGLYGE